MPFVIGKSYYWTLSNTPSGKPEMGTIVLPKSDDSKKIIQVEDLSNHFNNLNAISAYYNGQYFFDVYSLLNKCIKEYPDNKLYRIMLENILVE